VWKEQLSTMLQTLMSKATPFPTTKRMTWR